ncbi:hypothetical protein BD414DRAFT_487738 [Trametes punicea]|nr:hypothetical protein BD414DRAFT_487738 [Trametes punicea]
MVELADSIASTSSSMYVTAGNGGPSSSGSDTDPNLSRNERLSHNAWSGSTTADYPSQLVTQRRTNEGIVSSAKSEYHANERANEEEGKTNYVSDPESGPWHGGVGDRRLLLSASAEPHAQRVSRAKAVEPCSPSRFIPSPSPFPVSPTLLDAENRSNGVSDNLSRSSSYTTHSSAQRGDSWMAEPRDATNTLNSRKAVDTRDSLKRGSSTASRTGSHIKARSRRSSQLSEPSTPTVSSSKENGGAGPSSTAFPTLSPSPTPVRVPRTPRTASEPGLRSVSEKSVLETPMNTKGKRKADEVDITPPDQRAGHHATFVLPEGGHRSHHASEISRAPSSYHGRKRARLSTTSPSASPSQSRPASVSRHPTDSWPSRSVNPSSLQRAASKTASMRSGARSESMIGATNRNSERRRSLSEISIPISALVTPHAPSMSVRSSMYHMRDPRKPPRVHPTHWHLELSTPDHDGSPVQAWLFFLGFIFFPLWYIASFWRIPKTRQVGGTDTEKAVTLDDPQVEHDARSWRLRCRVMSVVSLFTYIPFIILLAIFVPRS